MAVVDGRNSGDSARIRTARKSLFCQEEEKGRVYSYILLIPKVGRRKGMLLADIGSGSALWPGNSNRCGETLSKRLSG